MSSKGGEGFVGSEEGSKRRTCMRCMTLHSGTWQFATFQTFVAPRSVWTRRISSSTWTIHCVLTTQKVRLQCVIFIRPDVFLRKSRSAFHILWVGLVMKVCDKGLADNRSLGATQIYTKTLQNDQADYEGCGPPGGETEENTGFSRIYEESGEFMRLEDDTRRTYSVIGDPGGRERGGQVRRRGPESCPP
ncbi:hypothetical protein J6590_012030 [Homalodisca vitripennis]|nr:hypothetical protein J6590_012030 [Homalodisca vitripennis]